MNKNAWKRLKKVVRPAFGCTQHPKAGRNTQQTMALTKSSQSSLGLLYQILDDELQFLYYKDCVYDENKYLNLNPKSSSYVLCSESGVQYMQR